MPFTLRMRAALKPHYCAELCSAKAAFARRDYPTSWRHLERAHVLGQPYPVAHTAVHWQMLLFGLRLKNLREIIGQLPRLFVGGVKSFVGHIPVGNTGGANVPALQPMEIPADLRRIIETTSLPSTSP